MLKELSSNEIYRNWMIFVFAVAIIMFFYYVIKGMYKKEPGMPKMQNPPPPPVTRRILMYEIKKEGSIYPELMYAKELEATLKRISEMNVSLTDKADIKMKTMQDIKAGLMPVVAGLLFTSTEASVIQAYVDANKEKYPDDAEAYQEYWKKTILPRVNKLPL